MTQNKKEFYYLPFLSDPVLRQYSVRDVIIRTGIILIQRDIPSLVPFINHNATMVKLHSKLRRWSFLYKSFRVFALKKENVGSN